MAASKSTSRRSAVSSPSPVRIVRTPKPVEITQTPASAMNITHAQRFKLAMYCSWEVAFLVSGLRREALELLPGGDCLYPTLALLDRMQGVADALGELAQPDDDEHHTPDEMISRIRLAEKVFNPEAAEEA